MLIALTLLFGAATAWLGWRCLKQGGEFAERERHLLRTMREQEDAHIALQAAHRELEQRAAQLARSNAELERFAHVASHDLKEPVRTVISYTQLLARKFSGVLDAEAHEYIKGAAEAARSIRSRIESLLDFAIVGEDDNPTARTDSRVALEKAVANLRPAILDSGASIHCEALPTVQAHQPEVVLLFQNLLDNAIKFRSLTPPEVRISAQRSDGSQWKFEVQDNGIGIDPKASGKLFELFERLDQNDGRAGLGMGLAICKKIVESHGGHIWFEPADHGSRFLFTLPAPG